MLIKYCERYGINPRIMHIHERSVTDSCIMKDTLPHILRKSRVAIERYLLWVSNGGSGGSRVVVIGDGKSLDLLGDFMA